MDTITIERNQRIKMFFNEYYFGVPIWMMIFRLIGGPFICFIGLTMYSNASERFGIAYGGFAIAFSIYYTLIPFLWVLIKWKYYKTIKFQIEATSDKLILKEDESESLTEYSKFEKILKRKNYFALRIQKGLKIYVPIAQLSQRTVEILTEKMKK